MEMNYSDRYYARLFSKSDSDVVLDKDDLLALAGLLIDLNQLEWLEEIKTRSQALR